MGAAVAACCVVALCAAPAAFAAEKKAAAASKAGKSAKAGKGAKATKPKKIEKLACKTGTEDHHARIAVVLWDGKVREFAYYSIWKPRTCSLYVQMGDPYSTWEEFKAVTTITLAEEKGAVLIDHEPGKYKFIFREVDRMRYCGADGTLSGSLTIRRGRAQCELDGVMDDDPSKPPETAADGAPPNEPPAAAKPAAGAGIRQ